MCDPDQSTFGSTNVFSALHKKQSTKEQELSHSQIKAEFQKCEAKQPFRSLLCFLYSSTDDVRADLRICNTNLVENAVAGLFFEWDRICFRRSDAPDDRFPNNNHIAMNIIPGRWHLDQMSVTLLPPRLSYIYN